jgi:hypothetical protein
MSFRTRFWISAISLAVLGVLAIPVGGSSASVTAAYSCNLIMPGKTYTYVTAELISGQAGVASYKPGAPVTLVDWSAKVVFPKAVVNALTKYTTTVTGTVTVFKISGSDVSPTVVNAAGAGISIGTVKLVANKAATVQIPAAPITVSGWKAASTPGTIALSTGKVKIDLVVTVQGSPVLMPVTCAPDPSATIATSTVS